MPAKAARRLNLQFCSQAAVYSYQQVISAKEFGVSCKAEAPWFLRGFVRGEWLSSKEAGDVGSRDVL
jgi:hypothetical protein